MEIDRRYLVDVPDDGGVVVGDTQRQQVGVLGRAPVSQCCQQHSALEDEAETVIRDRKPGQPPLGREHR